MSIFEIFSKRQKRLRGDVPDVYTYDDIPEPLRVQIIHIWHDVLGGADQYDQQYLGTGNAYRFIVETLCREYGRFALAETNTFQTRHFLAEFAKFFLAEREPDKVLDAIELSFKVVDRSTRDFTFLHRPDASERADGALEELNSRFREHGVGYQFLSGEIIRVDSQLLHAQVVKPALSLLTAPEFAGAEAEFLKAHEHYRHGRQKEALAECLKALESVMKVICGKRKWGCDPHATAKTLIQVLIDKELIPAFWNQHFSALRSTLEAGVPTARNRLAGHGQGAQLIQIPEHVVAYVLHQTAAAIVFLVEAEQALP